MYGQTRSWQLGSRVGIKTENLKKENMVQLFDPIHYHYCQFRLNHCHLQEVNPKASFVVNMRDELAIIR